MPGQSRQKIPKLSQLHLNFAFTGMGAPGENIQDELRAINHFEIRDLGNGASLRRGEILVEDHEVGSLLERAHHHLFQFAFSEQVSLEPFVGALGDAIQHADPGGFGQFFQLFQMFFLLGMTSGSRADQNGGFAPSGDVMRAVRSLQIAIEPMEENVQLKVEIMERNRLQEPADFSLLIGREQMRQMQQAGLARFVYTQDPDQVQSQERQMGQIVLAQRVIMEMGANQPETAEGMRSDSELCQRFEGRCAAGSHKYLFDDTAASDQETDGTSNLPRQLAGRARELGSDHE